MGSNRKTVLISLISTVLMHRYIPLLSILEFESLIHFYGAFRSSPVRRNSRTRSVEICRFDRRFPKDSSLDFETGSVKSCRVRVASRAAVCGAHYQGSLSKVSILLFRQ